MDKKEFDSLNDNDRAFTVEGYIDGFKAAIECAESVIVRVGDPAVDRMFISNRDMIVLTLNASLKRLAESELKF
jgi:hypothetical protein